MRVYGSDGMPDCQSFKFLARTFFESASPVLDILLKFKEHSLILTDGLKEVTKVYSRSVDLYKNHCNYMYINVSNYSFNFVNPHYSTVLLICIISMVGPMNKKLAVLP